MSHTCSVNAMVETLRFAICLKRRKMGRLAVAGAAVAEMMSCMVTCLLVAAGVLEANLWNTNNNCERYMKYKAMWANGVRRHVKGAVESVMANDVKHVVDKHVRYL